MPQMMQVRPRRFASPLAAQRAMVEPVQQPLYSCFVFDAALVPADCLLFQYPVGGTIAGNVAALGTATELQTNMLSTGQLPSPKIFLATGIRVIPIELLNGWANPVDDTAGDSTAVTFTGNDSDLLEDLMRIIYGSVTVFHVGVKDYLMQPTFNNPANTGIMGVSDSQLEAGATPTNTMERQRFQTFHSHGRYFAFDRYPILIPSQQNFDVRLKFPMPTRPTLGATRPVYVFIDGISGREVQ